MNVSLWQAHLSFVLLGFLFLGAWLPTRNGRLMGLAVLTFCSFIPVNELPLAAYVRSFTDDLAITSLLLLGALCLARLGLLSIPVVKQRQALLVFAVFAVCLYPATLGLTYFDPYRWGYNPRPMIVVIGLVALAMLFLRNGLVALMLAGATLAFALRLKASENYWDYLMDPLLALYCVTLLIGLAVSGLWQRSKHLMSRAWRPHVKITE